jgi:hypothetical protein
MKAFISLFVAAWSAVILMACQTQRELYDGVSRFAAADAPADASGTRSPRGAGR